jgi:hypothetical protein
VSVPFESLHVGKCYLMETGQVRRVLRIMPDGRFQYEHRMGHAAPEVWRARIQSGRSFADLVEREVPCDWMPERDDEEQGMR